MSQTELMTSKQSSLSSKGEAWYPGLDGVRGLAVFLVFTIHYVPAFLGYIGWMGVPIFFVLSGFLITGVLYDNRNEPHRYRNFYVRRTLRIFPLFYFIWLFIFVVAFFYHERWQPILVLWPVYLGNYVRFFYGSTAMDRVWTSRFAFEIGHFWSLAVEEQFYLLWPLVVFSIKDRRKLIRICIAVVVAVLLLRIGLFLTVPHQILDLEFLSRMTFSQADAFLLGGLLALLMRGPHEVRLLRLGTKLFAGSITALVILWLLHTGTSLSRVTATTPWMTEYGFTLVNLASSGLILASLQPGSLLFPFMKFRPLRVLGKYSYGFYVYHVLIYQALVGFVQNRWRVPAIVLYPIDFIIILGVSAASYHILEMPFLRLKTRFTARHASLEDVPQTRDPLLSETA